ncbi:hypothetical protein [Ilumatobacter coccineus]|uniref:Uncharacterized protein n=1 Tax=Ilumatobacter coccineus (strain NBRC 103263 / KCTC 29153 / YM16-304) TaxID=1313172 RepID=A0A6C7E635_ILUCY|nr:hypothetical protein [Ilumatobacter coccineus]BAN01981.1 hypothetical protein YM304_16670 [Ilumatobacter coccineus YM16-304]
MSIEPRRPDMPAEVEVVAERRTIVTALPLKKAARQRLAELLDARVVDVRDPVDHVDLVLTPSCSPQLIGALSDKYDGARVVVVELDDWEFGVELGGPVKRILRSGASAYVLADSIDELASKISTPSAEDDRADAAEVHELAAGATVDEVIAAFLRESVEYSARVHTPDS